MLWYEVFDKLVGEKFPAMEVRCDEPMRDHTTFRIGGGAKRMAFPATMEEMIGLLSLAEENNWSVFVVGNGSNLLVGNVALAYLGLNRQLYADLTPEGLYTLSDGMVEECSFVDGLTELDSDGNVKKIEILFCTDPDNLISSPITRIPYFMATALDNKFENIFLKY